MGKRLTPEEKAARATPKWAKASDTRRDTYHTPVLPHDMLTALRHAKPTTDEETRKVCAPFLLEYQPRLDKGAQQPCQATYDRLVLTQRAYLRSLGTGNGPDAAWGAASVTWHDRPDWTPLNAPPGNPK